MARLTYAVASECWDWEPYQTPRRFVFGQGGVDWLDDWADSRLEQHCQVADGPWKGPESKPVSTWAQTEPLCNENVDNEGIFLPGNAQTRGRKFGTYPHGNMFVYTYVYVKSIGVIFFSIV